MLHDPAHRSKAPAAGGGAWKGVIGWFARNGVAANLMLLVIVASGRHRTDGSEAGDFSGILPRRHHGRGPLSRGGTGRG